MPTEAGARGARGTRPARVCVLGSYAEALVLTADRIPQPGETLVGRDYRQTYGGKGSDMAVQAARLGADVAYVGVVGDDAFGRGFADLMRAEGVDTTHLRVTDERPTGVGMIIKDVRARNVIVVDMGANELFGPDDVDAAAPAITAWPPPARRGSRRCSTPRPPWTCGTSTCPRSTSSPRTRPRPG
jgi:ribokinase